MVGGNDERKMGKYDDQGETCMNKDLHTRKEEWGQMIKREEKINQRKLKKEVDRVGTEILFSVIFSYNNQGSIDDMIKG